MKGFPLKNLLAIVVGLFALAIPLLRVDRPAPSRTADAAAVVPAGEVPVMLQLRLVHPPLTLEITNEGKPVPLRGAGLERGGETVLTNDGAALELAFKATWPPGTPGTMVEVRAAPDGMREQQRNVWADAGTADEIVYFTWRGRP